MNKNIAIIGVLALVLVGGAAFLKGEAPASTTEVASTGSAKELQNNNQAQVVNAVAPINYTVSEVAKHNDAKSCWSIISGNVYDVTNWISEHPGGPEVVLSTCGKDATSMFTQAHGGSKKIMDLLNTMKIGSVK